MKNKIKKQNLGERMYGYELVTKSKLMPKQASIVKINFINYDKLMNNLNLDKKELNQFIVDSISYSIARLSESISNIVFGYYQNNEVMLLLRDDVTQEQEQYFKGDVQSIVSVVASRFTYEYNSYLAYLLNETIEEYTPAYFNVSAYNLPTYEVINNFIFKQRESIKLLGSAVHTKGFVFYKQEVDFYQSSSNVLLGIKYNTVSKLPKLQMVVDYEPPIFSQNKTFIENFLH